MTHAPRGSQGSPVVDVDCSLTPSSGGYEVFFRIATLQPGQENFDDSQEGLLAVGFLPAVGQELRMGALGGYVQIRGLGWSIARAPIGPSMDTGRCHVFIDRLASGGFTGRIACNAVNDDSTPARARNIRGATGASPDYGEFVFTNCATR
jgi:hypothetical protein